MKKNLSKQQAQEEINNFFKKDNYSSKEVKKIKKIAMKFNIKLREYRGLFCKKCLSKLKGKSSVKKTHKVVRCSSCGHENKIKNLN